MFRQASVVREPQVFPPVDLRKVRGIHEERVPIVPHRGRVPPDIQVNFVCL